MRIRVLGCSGGVGAHRETTSFLFDDDVLIDAGSGVATLDLDQMASIRHILLTHSHLDHILSIPLMVDSIFDRIDAPILIHAQPVTLDALRKHIFNGVIWPDFTRLPHPERPVLRFVPMAPGEPLTVNGRTFEMIPVDHLVPTVGYRVSCPTGVFAFSGDTTINDTLWEALNDGERLDLLFVEAAFTDQEVELCRLAKHYCPRMLAADLRKLRHRPSIYLSHAKPGGEEQILAQCREAVTEREIATLVGGEVFTL